MNKPADTTRIEAIPYHPRLGKAHLLHLVTAAWLGTLAFLQPARALREFYDRRDRR